MGSRSTADIISEWKESTEESEQLQDCLYHERHMKIICIGAGPSGLCFAYKLQRSFRNYSLTIYEKNEDVTGTWFENRYPGCACDVPSHNYTWTFEPKKDWSSIYAQASEVRGYFDGFMAKHRLEGYCKTRHKVVSAKWLAQEGKWTVSVLNTVSGELFEDSCHILVNAGGYLNSWHWPSIPGLRRFRGPLLHSAAWDEAVELRDKRVGLIGNGSSGIQILPAIQPLVQRVTNFIRQPNWIAPGEANRAYTAQELDDFAHKPGALLELRKRNEVGVNRLFGLLVTDSKLQRDLRRLILQSMDDELRDNEALKAKLVPEWAVGCRRLTPGTQYLQTLKADNVELVKGEIVEVTEDACVCSDGHVYPVDVLICATGFDTSFRPRFPIIGDDGRNLQNAWADEPEAYMGIAAAGFPNYLMFAGPHSPISNGPVLSAIEVQADYILKLCDRWQTENMHSFQPKAEAVRDFLAHVDAFMPKMVWSKGCRTWHNNGRGSKGRVCLWPGSTLHYIEAMSEVRADDWEIRYEGNRFQWLGNGFSQAEYDPTCDLGYYIREADDGPFLSKGKQREWRTKHGSVVADSPDG